MSELESLRRRIAELEDRNQVVEALYRYAHAFESGTDEEFVDCFTDDGVFEIRYGAHYGGRPMSRHEGAEQIRRYVAGHASRGAGRPQFRMLADPIVRIDGDQATARSYLVGVQPFDGQPELIDLGRYEDRLRRVAPGDWRIAERVTGIDRKSVV